MHPGSVFSFSTYLFALVIDELIRCIHDGIVHVTFLIGYIIMLLAHDSVLIDEPKATTNDKLGVREEELGIEKICDN